MVLQCPSRALRAHALQGFLSFHFHNLHTNDDFCREIAWKCTQKWSGDLRKLERYFEVKVWRLWKQKNKNPREDARDARTRETRAYFFIWWARKEGKVKKVFLENSCHHATRNWKWWKGVDHSWCNGRMFRVEVWQQANPKEGKKRGNDVG